MRNRRPLNWQRVVALAIGLGASMALAILASAGMFKKPDEVLATEATSEAELQKRVVAAPVLDSDPSLDALLPYDEISLERTGCFGECPIFRVTFHRDGRAELDAKAQMPHE